LIICGQLRHPGALDFDTHRRRIRLRNGWPVLRERLPKK